MKSKATFLLLFMLNTSFAQSPTNELTNDEKIYGLSKLWSEVNRNFANFDLTQINWDSTYQSFIPKVMATKNDGDYYKELMRMMALIKDGHSNVYYNPFFVYKSLPLKTKLIEDKIIVIEVNNDTLIMKNKIEIGDEIIEINKKNALDYAKNEIMPFQSASTVQDLNVRTFTYALLTGKPDELVELKIKKIDNIILNTTISRKLISNFKRQTYELKITDNNVAHLVVNDFQNDSYQKIFDSLFVKLMPSKALIIDLRNNSGGDSGQGFYILSHLISKTAYGAKAKTKQYIPTLKAWEQPDMWMEFAPDVIKPIDGKVKYLNPVVVLTSAKTYSAGEDFLVAFDNAKRGIKIGQTTGGSTGQPIFFDLPKGGFARVCTKRDIYPDGKEFIGIGIKPEVEVFETVKSIRERKDIVLEKALEYLKLK